MLQALKHRCYRFRCTTCSATRDQEVRREEAKLISCVCGGTAEKIADSPLEGRINWWIGADGEYLPGKVIDNGAVMYKLGLERS